MFQFILFLLCITSAGAFQQQGDGAPAEEQTRTPGKFIAPGPHPIPEPQLAPPPPPLEQLTATGPADEFQQNAYLLGRSGEAVPPPKIPAVLRAILGLAGLLILAYLGGHPRIQQIERQFNVGHLITTGLPFLLLGLIASQPRIGILTPSVLYEVSPLIPLTLGWIGFAIGARLEAHGLDRLTADIGYAFATTIAFPLVLVFAACSLTIISVQSQPALLPAIRDALILATAGAMAARSAPYFLRVFSRSEIVSERSVRLIELEQLAGVLGILMLSAFHRPQGQLVNWQLPGTAWLFVTLGIGTTMGVFIYAALTRLRTNPQFTAVLLGSIAFTAGMASFLRLSPLAVCCIAGAITANLGGIWKIQMRNMLERIERPIYFLFMVIAGALWHPSEWQGWVLMAVFILSRGISKWLSAEVVRRWVLKDVTHDELRTMTWAPMGALSIAIVVSAQDLYSGPTISWIVTAVVAGALAAEVALQMAARKTRHAGMDVSGRAYGAPAGVD